MEVENQIKETVISPKLSEEQKEESKATELDKSKDSEKNPKRIRNIRSDPPLNRKKDHQRKRNPVPGVVQDAIIKRNLTSIKLAENILQVQIPHPLRANLVRLVVQSLQIVVEKFIKRRLIENGTVHQKEMIEEEEMMANGQERDRLHRI